MGSFKILATPQLTDEFERLREKAVSDGLSTFSKEKASVSFPPFARAHPKFAEVKSLLSLAFQKLDDFTATIREEAQDRDLFVDDVISDLVDAATMIFETEQIVAAAQLRSAKGNPPGKRKDTIGDAVHWESLLSQADVGDHLCLISSDGDFYSELDKSKPKDFLVVDWLKETKHGKLETFRTISSFLADHDPEIEIGSENSAENKVMKLEKSESFQRTHDVLERLRSATGLTVEHVNRIIVAFEENPNVGRIQQEREVQDFIGDLFEGFGATSVGSCLHDLLDDWGG